jgi:hypothetical protein
MRDMQFPLEGILFFFMVLGMEPTQGLKHARSVLSHSSHTPSPFACTFFFFFPVWDLN